MGPRTLPLPLTREVIKLFPYHGQTHPIHILNKDKLLVQKIDPTYMTRSIQENQVGTYPYYPILYCLTLHPGEYFL